MKPVILASHGDFSKGLKESVEMIMGPQEHMTAISLEPSEDETLFLEKIRAISEDLTDYVVFVDILGGTPCNIFNGLLLEKPTFTLYAGMSLPMIIQHLNNSFLDSDADLVEQTKTSIVCVNSLLS